MNILWLKAFHLFFMLAWMAGLFYLPRLFVYHASTQEQIVRDAYKVMERRLWWFVTPFAVLTFIFGLALIYQYGIAWFRVSTWLHIKLVLLLLIYGYHGYLYVLMRQFAQDANQHSSRFYRILNEAPVLLILAIVVLAVTKQSLFS